MFNRETPTPFASSSLLLGGDLFLRIFADVLPSAAVFPMDTGVCNSLSVSAVGSSFQFPWDRFPNSDLRKNSLKNTSGLIGENPVTSNVSFLFLALANFAKAFRKMMQMSLWNCKPGLVVYRLAASSAYTLFDDPEVSSLAVVPCD